MKPTSTLAAALALFAACHSSSLLAQSNQQLSDKLMRKDSILFDAALKTCNIQALQSVFAPEFVFEQDGGDGKAPSSIKLEEFVGRIESRCGKSGPKVRRETVDVTAYRQGTDLAIQRGLQRFYVLSPDGKEQLVETSRFSRSWKPVGHDWKMTYELNYPDVSTASSTAPVPKTSDSHTQNPLFRQIAELDQMVFSAFNDGNLDQFMSFFSRDLEFYHDRGGLTNYEQNVTLFKRNFADRQHKMRRELVPGTMEVYPLGQYGALQTGVHHFYQMENGTEQRVATAKFTQIWRHEKGKWLITREISYDHQ